MARTGLPAFAVPLLGSMAGISTAALAAFVNGNPAQMAALPVAVGLLAFLVLDRRKLLLSILVLRSAGDILLDSTRVTLGSYPIGVGGLLNAFVILIVALLVLEKPRLLPRRALAMWAGLLLAALIGVALSPAKGDAIRTVLGLLSWFAVFTGTFYVVRSPEDFRFCVKLILWSSAIPVACALVELAASGGMRAEGGRLHATFAHPNIFAFYLIVVMAAALYLLKSETAKPAAAARIALAAYVLLLIGLLVLTKTRSAWLACFAMFAIYGLFFERRYLVYLLVAPLAALLVPGVQERLADLGTGNEYVQYARLNSFAWRRLLWETALKWMRPEHYVLGYGLESFRQYAAAFFPMANPAGAAPGAHNIYVQLFFELGALGLLAFAWLFGRLAGWIKSLSATDRLASLIVFSLILAYLIAAFSDNMFSYLSFNWYFWFLAGAACARALLGAGDTAGALQEAPRAHSGAGAMPQTGLPAA